MHDLGAQRQGGGKTQVPGEKPSESDRDGQSSPHMRTRGIDPGSYIEVGSASDDHYANLTFEAKIPKSFILSCN